MTQKNARKVDWYYLIDGLRGLALLNMLAFHFMYDACIIFGKDPSWYKSPFVQAWQQYICISFIFISGISWHFSKNNIKRGIQLNLFGFAITAVTLIFLPSQAVWFGILNFIGCAALLMGLVERYLRGQNAAAGLILSLFLFLLFYSVPEGWLSFGTLKLLPLPRWLYEVRIFTFLGLPYSGFASSDFFPLLPWIFLFLAGYWFWELVCQEDRLRSLFRTRIPLLSSIGARTIWIYLIHQPVLYLVSGLLFGQQ